MEKNRFFLKSDLPIGKDAPTALNILIGANTQSQMKEEKAKINALIGSRLPISIITDLSLFSSDKEQPLWKIVAEDGRCVPGTVPVYQAVDNNGCLACNVNVIIETPGHVAPQGIFQLCDYLLQSCQHPIMPFGFCQ